MRGKCTLIAGAVAHAVAAAASAQPAGASIEADTAAQLPEVIVVGSRIRRVDLETSQPVFVIERAQIERTGLVSVGDILQDLATSAGTLNTTVNFGGNGETRLNLRNLGENRTLVLVNGRRWNVGLGGAVDLNSIPLSIIERIEVLRDGASAIYGSDAIAGVVNITTRSDYDGLEARAYLGENEEGDGRVESYDFTVGAEGENGNVVLNASYVKQEPIHAGDRAVSAVPVFGLPATDLRAGASSNTPFGRFGFGPAGNCAFDPGGTYPEGPAGCNGRQGRPPPARNRFDPDTGGYPLFDPTIDGYNYAPENYLQTPQERTSLYVQGRFRFSDSVTATAEVLYNERRSAQLQAPVPLQVGVPFDPPLDFTIPANHIYNPFGQEVNFLALRPGGQQRHFSQDADTVRIATGLHGDFEFLDRNYAWDLSGTQSEQTVDRIDRGLIDVARLGSALGPSFRDAAGVARCGAPPSAVAGCVPLDPFHGPAAFTAEMLEYLYFAAQSSTSGELWDYGANLTGGLFDLPAGPLAFAAGYEYRREQGVSLPDALLQSGALSGDTVQPISGTTSVDEWYAEFSVPLLVDVAAAELLDLSLAARRSDYSTVGSTTNYKAGMRWKPVAELLVRGNYSQGFRAPSLEELFDGGGSFIDAVENIDPCVAGSDPTNPANCVADGVPGGAYEPQQGIYRVVYGGNPDLGPETAISRTLGLVWSPPWLPGFDLALDWYRIEIDDAVANPFEGDLVNSCIFDAVPAACERTLRDPASGELLEVDVSPLNSGVIDVEGYDLTLRYRVDTRAGRFAMVWDSTYYADYLIEVPSGAPVLSNVGNYFPLNPSWRYRSNLDVSWQRGDWEASFAARYYAGLDEGCFVDEDFFDACSAPDVASPIYFGFPENRIDDRWYFDAQAAWSAAWDAQVRVGIQNVFDQDPPSSLFGMPNSFDPAYPVPGRFWYLSYTQHF